MENLTAEQTPCFSDGPVLEKAGGENVLEGRDGRAAASEPYSSVTNCGEMHEVHTGTVALPEVEDRAQVCDRVLTLRKYARSIQG